MRFESSTFSRKGHQPFCNLRGPQLRQTLTQRKPGGESEYFPLVPSRSHSEADAYVRSGESQPEENFLATLEFCGGSL